MDDVLSRGLTFINQRTEKIFIETFWRNRVDLCGWKMNSSCHFLLFQLCYLKAFLQGLGCLLWKKKMKKGNKNIIVKLKKQNKKHFNIYCISQLENIYFFVCWWYECLGEKIKVIFYVIVNRFCLSYWMNQLYSQINKILSIFLF